MIKKLKKHVIFILIERFTKPIMQLIVMTLKRKGSMSKYFIFILSLVSLNSVCQNINVPKSVADQKIEDRLNKIITASGWFPSLQINVSEGLVLINGKYNSQEKKEWIKNIISQTEGVVATIDKANVEAEVISVVEPAKQEANLILKKSKKILPYLLSSLGILLFFFFIAYLSRKLTRRIVSGKKSNELLTQAAVNIVSLMVLLIGIYFALRASGLSGLAYTILGGTGALGLGLGLAFKNSFENYLSGIMISMRDIFRRGEVVEIGEFEGVVQAVTTRGTTLMDFEGNSVTIPNSLVFSSAVKNYTRNPHMRTDFTVGIGYDDSIDEARSIILKHLTEMNHSILQDPKPIVSVDALGSSTVNLKGYFWFDTTKFSKVKIKSHVLQRIKIGLMQGNISMPDDAREVVFASPLEINNISQSVKANADKPNSSSSNEKIEKTPDFNNEVNDVKEKALLAEASENGQNLLN